MSTSRIQRGLSNITITSQPYTILKLINRKLVVPRSCNVYIAEITLGQSTKISITPHTGTKETTRESTDTFVTNNSGIVGSNICFFSPYPSADLNTNVIGFLASKGVIVSAWEAQPGPDSNQSYAIVNYAPAINIDPSNVASIVTRNASDLTGHTCNEPAVIWNAFAGSAQIITNGAKTIPTYPTNLTAGQGYDHTNSWYDQITARTCVGINSLGNKLYIAVAEVYANSYGLTVGEMVDLILLPLGINNAINVDGGGSSLLVTTDPQDGSLYFLNTPKEGTPRLVGGNISISLSPLQTQQGKARIKNTATKTQTGKATIKFQPSRTQTGLTRVRSHITRTQAGIGRIKVHVSPTQQGKGCVDKLTSRTQLSISRIKKSTLRTQTGKSKLLVHVRHIMIGYSSIVPYTSKSINGICKIKKPAKKIILGISRII